MFVTVAVTHHWPSGSSKHAKRNMPVREWTVTSANEALRLLMELGEEVEIEPQPTDPWSALQRELDGTAAHA
jgi:hypothetical protein